MGISCPRDIDTGGSGSGCKMNGGGSHNIKANLEFPGPAGQVQRPDQVSKTIHLVDCLSIPATRGRVFISAPRAQMNDIL